MNSCATGVLRILTLTNKNMKNICMAGLIILITATACKKNRLGGKAFITGKVEHHARAIPNATVYIKFNAKEFPGENVSLYDALTTADGTGSYTFRCYKGDYYLYARGIDSLPQPEAVSGGVPVHIRAKEEVKANIAVSEVH